VSVPYMRIESMLVLGPYISEVGADPWRRLHLATYALPGRICCVASILSFGVVLNASSWSRCFGVRDAVRLLLGFQFSAQPDETSIICL
jgi:hypothetical protein